MHWVRTAGIARNSMEMGGDTHLCRRRALRTEVATLGLQCPRVAGPMSLNMERGGQLHGTKVAIRATPAELERVYMETRLIRGMAPPRAATPAKQHRLVHMEATTLDRGLEEASMDTLCLILRWFTGIEHGVKPGCGGRECVEVVSGTLSLDLCVAIMTL